MRESETCTISRSLAKSTKYCEHNALRYLANKLRRTTKGLLYLEKLPSKERARLKTLGFNQCSSCLHVFHYDFFSETEFYSNKRCYKCRGNYERERHGNCKNPAPRRTPGDRRRGKILEQSGYRKCYKCKFSLPHEEFYASNDTCKRCVRGDERRIANYLDGFGLKSCTNCSSIKRKCDFYFFKSVGRYDPHCKVCSTESAYEWKQSNIDASRYHMRNAANKRRAFKRHLPSRPISRDEEKLLLSQRMEIFGAPVTKKCVKCSKFKVLDAFYGDKSSKDGKQVYCKKCKTEYRANVKDELSDYWRDYQKRNKEQLTEYRRRYFKENPEVSRRSQRKRRALKRSLPHAPLTPAQYERLYEFRDQVFGEVTS
nr:MAG TPA: restriction endonuclease [Caudoviricetes sp.]